MVGKKTVNNNKKNRETMKTNNKKTFALILFLFFLTLTACNEWVEVDAENFYENTKTDQYYANLRAYKKSNHAISFGWYSKWFCTGPIGASYLMGLPDSLDIVSMWGGSTASTEAHVKDRDDVRRIKGTRLVNCVMLTGIDEKEWNWSNEDNGESAIRAYARALVKDVEDKCVDGLDLDYEPNYGARGNIVSYLSRVFYLIDELSKYLGPLSGTGRLLIVDGEPQSMPKETGKMFDYFVVQAYNCHSDSDLDRRLSRTVNNYNGILTPEEVTMKYVVTENFGSDIPKNYTDREGKRYEWTLQGMVNWKPKTGVRMGGFGTFIMQCAYLCTPIPWQLYRDGIQTLNPAKE